MSIGMLAQHVLVFFLIVVTPLWDWYEIPRLKASTEPRKKVRFYWKIVAASWACAIVAVVTVGIATVYAIQTVPGEIAWLDRGSRGAMVLMGIAAGMLIAIFVPAVLALWSEKIRVKAGKAAKKLAFLVPSTGEERRWWWAVCLTAGICEEVVYRGFLLHYFHTLPFHLSLPWALVASSVIFGIGHLYQGVGGAVQTAVIGFVFCGIFLVTGSLLVPIVVHAVLDLRVLVLLPEGFAAAAEG
ncbi:MAG TPA: CPBP family intramembrane glutamic endopeptidase [Candidatus Sulfotelmatobacter sp.]|jgi:membrane protease YdiL (CAAX protease family)|nr:CPBP family intramembrane glutamic endopeptidase [Candidatus Sulfotelmatobacter sp.]